MLCSVATFSNDQSWIFWIKLAAASTSALPASPVCYKEGIFPSTSASFRLKFCSFLTSLSLCRTEELGPCSGSGFGLRKGCGWFDLLPRPLQLPPYPSAIGLFHFLIIRVYTEVALFISFRKFSFAFTTWLFVTRGLASSLSWLSTCLPHWA